MGTVWKTMATVPCILEAVPINMYHQVSPVLWETGQGEQTDRTAHFLA